MKHTPKMVELFVDGWDIGVIDIGSNSHLSARLGVFGLVDRKDKRSGALGVWSVLVESLVGADSARPAREVILLRAKSLGKSQTPNPKWIRSTEALLKAGNYDLSDVQYVHGNNIHIRRD